MYPFIFTDFLELLGHTTCQYNISILIVQRNHVKRQLDENKNTPSERICPIVPILSYNIEDLFFKNEVQAREKSNL